MQQSLFCWCRAGLPLWSAALALFLAPIAFAQGGGFRGVTVDQVSVFSGAGPSFYVVGDLPKGAPVEVEDVVWEGWIRIAPPQGVFSYVSKAFVDAKGDGKSGVVNADKTEVKAASLNNPGDSYRRQLLLNKGDLVQILSEEGSFYKIVPPKGAWVYLPPNSVRRVEGLPPGPVRPTPAPPTTPVTPARPVEPVRPTPALPVVPTTRPSEPARTTGVTPVTPRPTTPIGTTAPRTVEATSPRTPATQPATRPVERASIAAVEPRAPRATEPARPTHTTERPREVEPEAPLDPAPRGPVRAEAESAVVRGLEARLERAAKLPLDQQPVQELLAGYEAAGQRRDLPPIDIRIVNIRVQQLRRNLDLASTLKSLRQTREQVAAPIAVPPQAAPPTRGVYDPSRYDAFGQLLASTVYDGSSGPRLYRLANPATQRTVGYVLPNASFEPQVYLGRIVGIIGSARYDPALKLRVIEVKQMELLAAEGDAAPAPGSGGTDAPAGSGNVSSGSGASGSSASPPSDSSTPPQTQPAQDFVK